jgi:beta-1,4-mannosyl-glycoprotein beta-1,4-N-acetylglucosaminyltransferase
VLGLIRLRRLRDFLKAKRDDYRYRRATESKIYDCFTFFNEVELLEFRIDYLKEVVDHFVIVEADQTHTGLPKRQNFPLDIFDDSVKNKIRYSYISFPENLPDPVWASGNSGDNILSWKREAYQRMRLIDGLHDARRDDIVLVTDLDEIPKRDTLLEIKKDNRIARRYPVVALEMSLFFYDVRGLASYSNGSAFPWRHPKFTARKNLECTNKIRLSPPKAIVHDGGWHFSYFGGVERIRTKLRSYAHTEVDTPENLSAVEKRVLDRSDIVGRDEFSYSDTYDKSKLPDLVLSEQYRKFFLGDG